MTEIEKSLNEVFEKIKLNSINIEFDNDNSRKLSIGTSKLGGKPDLPKNFEWYYFTGESQLTDEVANRPLSFLAQINCEEAKQYDIDSRLPKKGMLYFFYELAVVYDLAYSPETVDTTEFWSWKLSNSIFGKAQLVI
jgi:uncharacterized protein YwqG